MPKTPEILPTKDDPLVLRVTLDLDLGTRPYAGKNLKYLKLATQFTDDSSSGLITLAAESLPADAHPSLVFWRGFASEWLHAVCHVPEGQPFAAETIEPPNTERCATWMARLPPMQGAEYLSPDAFLEIWQRLQAWTLAQLEQLGDLGTFLETYAPNWSRVGRVTLHLAENPGDAEYPFAFMASYAAGLTKSGSIRRLPLGGALKEFAGEGKKAELVHLLSPVHAASLQSALMDELVQTGDIFHPLVWTPKEAFAFLQEIPLYEASGLLAVLPNWWRKRRRAQVSVTIGQKKGSAVGTNALLDFKLSVALGGAALSQAELEALMDQADGLVMMRGEWVEVNRAQLQEALDHWQRVEQQVGEGVSFIEGMRLLAGASTGSKEQVGLADHAEWTKLEAGEALQEVLADLRTPEGLSGPQPENLNGELRHYQIAGLNWLWICAQLGLGSCLADDMGLGKTIQVLSALLRHRHTHAENSLPSLLVVPASLIGNWKDEAQRFAPSLQILVAHRSELSAGAMEALGSDTAGGLAEVDLVITTYSMTTRLEWLFERKWAWIILDEAQAIKNPTAQQTRAIKQLDGSARVALTGTPVENRLGDLWSIFDFINPGLLGTAGAFQDFVQSLESRKPVDYTSLRNLVAPYILRRMKTDPTIVPDLPDKTEVQAFCVLSKPQAALYKQAVNELVTALSTKDLPPMQRRGLVLNTLMRFKQICNHPSQLSGDGVFEPSDSGKFDRLAELCRAIAERGEKVLVFTQFKSMCDPLAEFLAGIFGREGLVLHGGTPVGQRKTRVSEFQSPHGPPFFVLSIKAGGTGLNLTAASHVIHFDRWWNPAVENQATDRAFRIGQQRNVLVHKFVTRGTIEEKINAMIQSKQQMADAVLELGGEQALTEMSDAEIFDMVSLDLERATGWS